MAFFTFGLDVFAFEPESVIGRRLMIKQQFFPAVRIMTGVTALLFKLLFMRIFMTRGCVAAIVFDRFVSGDFLFVLFVAFFAFGLDMFAFKLKTLVSRRIMLKQKRFPPLCHMT